MTSVSVILPVCDQPVPVMMMKAHKHLIAASPVAAVSLRRACSSSRTCRDGASFRTCLCEPSRSSEFMKILSQLVSVVDGIAETQVNEDADVDETGDSKS